jgi:mannose-1-phosphate guanylyltransferase
VGPDETCLIIYADNLSAVDVMDMMDFHDRHEDPFTMLLFETPTPRQCGIATLDDDGRLVEFVEKPEHPKGNLANGGVYVVDGELYREIAEMQAFDLGFDVLPRLIGRMRGYVFDGYHRDIGNPESLEAARRDAPSVFGTKN